MFNFNDNKYMRKLIKFNGSQEEDFKICCLRVKAAFQSLELLKALETNTVADSKNEHVLSIVLSGLGDNPPRGIQSCTTTK